MPGRACAAGRAGATRPRAALAPIPAARGAGAAMGGAAQGEGGGGRPAGAGGGRRFGTEAGGRGRGSDRRPGLRVKIDW